MNILYNDYKTGKYFANGMEVSSEIYAKAYQQNIKMRGKRIHIKALNTARKARGLTAQLESTSRRICMPLELGMPYGLEHKEFQGDPYGAFFKGDPYEAFFKVDKKY